MERSANVALTHPIFNAMMRIAQFLCNAVVWRECSAIGKRKRLIEKLIPRNQRLVFAGARKSLYWTVVRSEIAGSEKL